LSQEKTSNQEYIGIPAEAYITENPDKKYKGNRDMNGQEPLDRKTPNIYPPVPERDIHYKYDDGNDDQ
jgi:hypothetical protein